jgi:hypothetical protein
VDLECTTVKAGDCGTVRSDGLKSCARWTQCKSSMLPIDLWCLSIVDLTGSDTSPPSVPRLSSLCLGWTALLQ